MAGWVAQRECAQCEQSFPAQECMSIGLTGYDYVVLGPVDDGPEGSVRVCRGCAGELSQLPRDLLVGVVRDLVELVGA